MSEILSNMDAKKAAVPDGEDRLSALPDELLLLVLSSLPSPQAVRTCVLATRWRDLWKSVPALRINSLSSTDFVNSLLHHRDRAPLDEYCEILVDDTIMDEPLRYAEQWLRYAVSCKVRDLRFNMLNSELQISAGALVSEHLTRLDLHRIISEDFSRDISSCQSLETLEIDQCIINIGNTGTDFPKSLRHLIIRDTSFLPKDTRSSISAPGLVTLELVDCLEWTPFLKSMPSLVWALIRIGHGCLDSSFQHNSFCRVCGGRLCVQCYGIDDRVLLKGLSGATNLELLSSWSLIFRREIKWCPIFSNLKTLLLCDWFMTANFSGLVYFLQHSPVLEILTLLLSNSCKKIETSRVYKPNNRFLVSKHLKTVQIEYSEEVGKIDEILNVLAYHGVQPELVNIERMPSKDCNYFEEYWLY